MDWWNKVPEEAPPKEDDRPVEVAPKSVDRSHLTPLIFSLIQMVAEQVRDKETVMTPDAGWFITTTVQDAVHVELQKEEFWAEPPEGSSSSSSSGGKGKSTKAK